MWKAFWNRIVNFFTAPTETQEARVKRLAYAAGILIKANNPQAGAIATGLKSILENIDEGGDKTAISNYFQRILFYIFKYTDKPEYRAAMVILLSEFNLNESNLTSNKGQLEIPLIKAAAEGLLDGMAL